MTKINVIVKLKYSDGKVTISCYDGDELMELFYIENITIPQALIYYNGLSATYNVSIGSEDLVEFGRMCDDFSKYAG